MPRKKIIRGRTGILSAEVCPDAVHEGIETDVQFIQLACEPTGERLDRRWTGHYRRRAGVGSVSKTVNTRFSPRSCAEWGRHAVGVSQCDQGQPRTT
jgi:hypothetical protein